MKNIINAIQMVGEGTWHGDIWHNGKLEFVDVLGEDTLELFDLRFLAHRDAESVACLESFEGSGGANEACGSSDEDEFGRHDCKIRKDLFCLRVDRVVVEGVLRLACIEILGSGFGMRLTKEHD